MAAGLHRPWLDHGLAAFTHLGDWAVLTTVVLAAVGVLLALRLCRPALILATAAAAGFLLGEGGKRLIDRPRPDVPWRLIALPSSPSFPSGHALESTAIYGTLALMIGRRLRRRGARLLVIALGLVLPALIGFSRVYLGVHYFTDALAGWLLGLVLVILAAWVDRRWSTRRVVGEPPSADRDEGRS